ncbi:DEAD/DEAH box helicase [Martelella soudanensis]|uniref:DEAD/DEAH box helicase n=1 Tax=unclassified Martelella TaxID=2629616 RepID=UPI0015DDED49|nr:MULTISPECIES: DEAD/DEAH box helicase [unclassified Martelella]
MNAFDQLAPPLQKWIRQQGWPSLRPVQTAGINAILGTNDDVIITAATAGGKTEAAFLPLISDVLLEEPAQDHGFDLVYVGPLKALINDQTRRLEDMCREAELAVVPWHGDIGSGVKSRALKAPRGVLLITPESLEALFVRRGSSIATLFGATRAIVLDELHTLLDSERGIQLRSLMTRMEISTGRQIRRVGLSATLGDTGLARHFLRREAPDDVVLCDAAGGGAEFQVQLRGYLTGGKVPEDEVAAKDDRSAEAAIAMHLFEKLRGSNNLVFAGSRGKVELYADRLRLLGEAQGLPQEFYPHHASLSKEHREFVEKRLKDASLPTTAICTSTLELGIDIGSVTCVAQIGAPFTVASLAQRLGRSGRRAGQPSILRQYQIEARLEKGSHLADRFRLGLVRAIAMIELYLQKWYEPPRSSALHLSTLVHQILAVIAERGGASAERLYATLCRKGPFYAVDTTLFLAVLRQIGSPDIALIEQSDNGLLLLGRQGEKLVEHYSFYAVFKTPEEFRLVEQGKDLGTLPVDNILAPGMTIIFSGRRWEIVEIHEREKVILVTRSRAGAPPLFGGDPGEIDNQVVEKMFEVLEGQAVPIYLDKQAAALLAEARGNFALAEAGFHRIIATGEDGHLIATRKGSVVTNTLALALGGFGFETSIYDGFIEVRTKEAELGLEDALALIAESERLSLFYRQAEPQSEKFHPFLSADLLQQDALSCRLDETGAIRLASEILASMQRQFARNR